MASIRRQAPPVEELLDCSVVQIGYQDSRKKQRLQGRQRRQRANIAEKKYVVQDDSSRMNPQIMGFFRMLIFVLFSERPMVFVRKTTIA